MDNDTINNIDDHSRTIIHIDFDCFYAQVEMIKNPSLYNVPLGIQQKNIVVTSNYVARDCGVQKCMLIKDAQEVCPNLVLVKGEDLYDYRKMSYQATAFLQRYSPLVERLGLDENFIDVSNLVNNRLHTNTNDIKVHSHIFGEASEICQCGCRERLEIGSVIAQEIRNGIKNELKLTSCAGIAHNKLLAKLVGSLHKPNQQTIIFPNSALELMLHLKYISKIPGVGFATTEILDTKLNIKTIENLHNCNHEQLKLVLTKEKAKWLLEMSYGNDTSAVKPSGKPQSIGLEDSCKSITVETEIKEKFHQLLTRLIILVSEDGRIPTTIKVTIRKFDNVNKISHRETRQCNISHKLFTVDKNTNFIQLSEQSENKLLSIIMHLFNKLVDISQSYHITLLGLSFTKFKERVSGRNSIASYFVKDVAVQSITSIENTETAQNFTKIFPTTSQAYNTDGSETEMEPSPKKSKFTGLIARHKQFTDPEYSSPSKLRVAELRLTSRDGDEICNLDNFNGNNSENMDTNQNIQCPPNADEDVFRELPVDVQQELWNEWKLERGRESDMVNKPHKKAKTNTLLNYFVKN